MEQQCSLEGLVTHISIPKIALIGLGVFGEQYANTLIELEAEKKVLFKDIWIRNPSDRGDFKGKQCKNLSSLKKTMLSS